MPVLLNGNFKGAGETPAVRKATATTMATATTTAPATAKDGGENGGARAGREFTRVCVIALGRGLVCRRVDMVASAR